MTTSQNLASPQQPTTPFHWRRLALGCLCVLLLHASACWQVPALQQHNDALQTPSLPDASNPKQRASGLFSWWTQATKSNDRRSALWQHVISPLSHLQQRKDGLWLRAILSFQGPRERLRHLGIEIDSQQGELLTTWIPIRAIQQLLREQGVRKLALSRWLRGHLNVSAPLVFAPQARFAHGLDGRGVVIGIIDTGIDFTHPAFRKEDGTTRIMAILDFSQQGEAPGLPKVITAKELNEALAGKNPIQHKDETGHGTHVAGIATGNGRSDNPKDPIRYMGMAPRSDLIVVKGLRAGKNDFSSADVVKGIQFIHQTATFLDRPYVINLSLGGHQGGHDGGSLLELALAPYTGAKRPGQLIVASAGNEGNDRIHASGWLTKGNPIELPLVVSKSKGNDDQTRIAIELWYPLAGQMTFRLRSPSGDETPLFVPGDKTLRPELFEWKSGIASVQSRRREGSPSGRSYAIVLAAPPKGRLQEGEWRLIIGGETPRFDAWIAEVKKGSLEARPYFSRYLTQELLIGIPASSAAVLTVGSYNSRSGWANAAGAVVAGAATLGILSPFTSPGPTRDNRPKPDITAPGLYIAAPTPLRLPVQARGKLPDGPYRISQGTSQAAPHLTGGLALMLQLDKRMTIDQARDLLHRTALTDQFTQRGAVYQRSWGHGKLNLLAAIDTLAKGASTRSVDPVKSSLGVLHDWLPADGQSTTRIIVIPKDAKGHPIQQAQKIQLNTTAGAIIASKSKGPKGTHWAQLRAAPGSGSQPITATITATINGLQLSTQRKVTFLPATNATGVGCQCNMRHGPTPAPPGAGWLFLLTWCILLRIRHKP